MAKSKTKSRSIPKSLINLDKTTQFVLNIIDPGYGEREILSDRDSLIQNILNSELDLSKGISGNNYVEFINDISRKYPGDKTDKDKNINLFTEDVGNIFGHFHEMYKNRYVELTDLKFISKFIPAIGEAVKVTLDSIVSADDMSSSIARNLKFSSSLSDEEKIILQSEIEKIERSEKLLRRLKNSVYKNTLVSGNYYIYAVPYSELFSEYDRMLKSGSINTNILSSRVNSSQGRTINKRVTNSNKSGFILNSANESTLNDSVLRSACESTFDFDSFTTALEGEDFTNKEIDEIQNDLIHNLGSITTFESDVLFEALEGHASYELMKKNLSSYTPMFGNVGVLDTPDEFTDAVGSSNGPVKGSKFNVTGTYVKYINANSMVPVRVYNQVVGYLHVHDTTASKKTEALKNAYTETNMVASTSGLFNSKSLTDHKRNKASQLVIDHITDGIIANFSNKFINRHVEFKEMIADCIISNGFINNSFQIQFIPANHVVPFTVNEDEYGNGQSILSDSLFPAKLLLSLIVSKLLLYMNNSGNRTIAHVKKGPIDINSANHTQRVIRMMQESNITFSDLLSTNLSFAKFNRNRNIEIPFAKNGDRLVDFETQEGQDVSMDTEMERWLEKLAILGTGVPSVMMEYVDVADYARSIVSANIKFAGRIASLQADLEESTTDLYKILVMNSNISDDLKTKFVNSFEFKLCRPKVISNTNISDYLSTVQSSTEALINLFIGQNSEDPNDEIVKKYFSKEIAMDLLPFMKWDNYARLLEEAKIAAAKEIDISDSTGDSDMGNLDDDSF